MATNFSAWLRETGSLYLRYIAVGTANIPLALCYALAMRRNWHIHLAFPALVLLGLIISAVLWRTVGPWQARGQMRSRPDAVVDTREARFPTATEGGSSITQIGNATLELLRQAPRGQWAAFSHDGRMIASSVSFRTVSRQARSLGELDPEIWAVPLRWAAWSPASPSL
jgi:hypothetical protein